ncbi:hypothetical protein PIB30_104131, partial [Stylosanthes scabra]|nr:hypothetical protein [Stylosanthes scabra]
MKAKQEEFFSNQVNQYNMIRQDQKLLGKEIDARISQPLDLGKKIEERKLADQETEFGSKTEQGFTHIRRSPRICVDSHLVHVH